MLLRERIAKAPCTPEERVLLSHIADLSERGQTRGRLMASAFLTEREQALVRTVLAELPLRFWGGYPDAERACAVYLPDAWGEDALYEDSAPVAAVRARFSGTLTHRDLLGALMGCGIERASVGDLLLAPGRCDFFVTRTIVPFVLQNLTSAGRQSLQLALLPLREVEPPEQRFRLLHDTVASVRLDAVCAGAFRLSREKAAQAIAAGRASVGGLPCMKPDRLLQEGDVLSLRGCGKAVLEQIGGTTKKGRTAITIRLYL